jgi:hypothetical protein
MSSESRLTIKIRLPCPELIGYGTDGFPPVGLGGVKQGKFLLRCAR